MNPAPLAIKEKYMEKIMEKASYCMNCKVKPCSVKGCPLNNNIPAFIEKIKEEKYIDAYKILSETTVLPGVCGRICPHLKQCQGSCIRGIKGEPVSIGELEAFILEINLIKKHDPHYNILLRDDKSYPYIEFKNDKYPSLVVRREINVNKKNKNLYGPYPNAYAARR